jgi:hypothetical protein
MAPAEPAEQPSGAFPWNALEMRRLPPPRFGNTLILTLSYHFC